MFELQPCPFCESRGTDLVVEQLNFAAGYVRCKHCGARGPLGPYASVVDMWNGCSRWVNRAKDSENEDV